MIYGPGFAEALAINSLSCMVIFSLEKLDKNAGEQPKWKRVPRRSVFLGLLTSSLCTCTSACIGGNGYYLRVLLLSIVSGGLLAAWVMDVETHLIYNFVWYISGSAGGVNLLLSGNLPEVWWNLLCFVLVQQLLFGRLYGRADCHAFSVCALSLGAMGMKMQDYLLQMLTAFLLLAAVQFAKCNVTRSGYLKIAIPFVPYITVSFWIMMLAKEITAKILGEEITLYQSFECIFMHCILIFP